MTNYCVYWFHFEEHTDPFTQGYIGITNDFERRYIEHKRHINSDKHNHFYNAVRKYSDKELQYTILHSDITLDNASALEEMYRPELNIAWNSAIGGMCALSGYTKSVTLFHESNPSKEYVFNSITEASTELGIHHATISQKIIRKSNTYGLDGWHVVHENTNKNTIITYSELKKKLLLGTKRGKPSHFKGMTNRWTDEEKLRIGSQHKGKTISEEQKRIVGEKNRNNTKLCSKITMKHIDSDIIHTFHSISEASRQLKLPLSRLKSKAQRPLQVYGKDGWAIMSKNI